MSNSSMRGIIWLASFPKSGNTWTRIFLTNYLRNSDSPADINQLDGGPIASAREFFDDAVGVEASELTPPEIERLRPQVYKHFASKLEDVEFMKVHDAYTLTPDGQPLFPREATTGVIYIMRNPLSVVPSLSNHGGAVVDDVINNMGGRHKPMEKHQVGLADQLRQRWLTWSEHVLSWVDAPGQRVLKVRYEDMKRDPFRVFRSMVRFSGMDDDEARIRRAIEFSSFDVVKSQEKDHGFRERLKSQSFFRKGQVAAWREELSQEQIQTIITDHAPAMRRFGYLTESGEPADALETEEFIYG